MNIFHRMKKSFRNLLKQTSKENLLKKRPLLFVVSSLYESSQTSEILSLSLDYAELLTDVCGRKLGIALDWKVLENWSHSQAEEKTIIIFTRYFSNINLTYIKIGKSL